jgi:hypothetical protein
VHWQAERYRHVVRANGLMRDHEYLRLG